LPGVSAPPPFGGNQRTVVVRVDPDRLRAYRMSGEEVVQALTLGNVVTPSGNVRIGDFTQMVPANSVVPNIQELMEIPVRTGARWMYARVAKPGSRPIDDETCSR
jgi:multidrug efflux pump subunit AcrB